MSNIVLTKCQHPVRIINKSTGEYMFVDCGHCANCRYNYRKKWQHRLELESRASVSTLFFTLTYSNDFIPTVLDSGDGYLHSQAGSRAESVNLSDYFNEPSKVFIPYVKSQTCGHEYEMGVCSKRDVQLFLKRLRRIISYDKDTLLTGVCESDKFFRYFVCAEIGPETYRPHYHGLLFFKSTVVSHAVMSNYIYKAWQYCNGRNLDCSRVFGDASSYVSKYVTANTSLPPIFKIKPYRTFHLFSRHPTIGVPFLSEDNCKVSVNSRTITYTQILDSDSQGALSVELPYPSQLFRYYLPKPFNPSCISRESLLQILNRSFKLCGYGLRKLDSENITDFLPNLVKSVKQKYRLFEFSPIDELSNIPKYRTYSDVDTFSYDDYWYGIPSNRMFIVRALKYCLKMDITPFDYLDLWFKYDSLIHSNLIKYQSDYENSLTDCSNITKFELLFPSFFLTLPKRLVDFDLFTEMVYNDYLQLFNLSLIDFYDSFGLLLERYQYENLRLIHRETADYRMFYAKVLDSDILFDKVRNLNFVRFNNC